MRFQNLLESNNDQESVVLIYGLLLLSHFSRVRLCDPIDGSPPGSPIPGILQARTLEWVSISFSKNAHMRAKLLQLCPTLRPHGQQSTRLLCPWDSPGKNTGVGCHFRLQRIPEYSIFTFLSQQYTDDCL